MTVEQDAAPHHEAPAVGSGGFGRYLVGEGIIDDAALLQALIEQQRRRQPLLHFLAELVPPQQLLPFLENNDGDAEAALRALVNVGVVYPDAAELCRRRYRQSAPPLGSLLAAAGHLQRSDVVRHLAAYHDSTNKATGALAVDPGQRQVPLTQRVEPVDATRDPLPEPEEIVADPEILNEFSLSFDEDAKVELETSLLALEGLAPQELTQALDGLYRTYHSAKGTAGFVNAKILARHLHRLEDCLSLAKRHAAEVAPGELSRLIDLQVAGLDLVWQHHRLIHGGDLEPVAMTEAIRSNINAVHWWSQEVVDRISSQSSSQSLDDLF